MHPADVGILLLAPQSMPILGAADTLKTAILVDYVLTKNMDLCSDVPEVLPNTQMPL